MRSTTNLRKLSALSVAVAATIGANSVRGATVTVFYDNIHDLTDGQSYSYATTAGNYAAIPTTINVAVGDTFQFGIDAVVTNNINSDAGKVTGTSGHDIAQPSYLGLSTLAIIVPSTDHNASILAPNTSGPPNNTFNSIPDFNSAASLNNSVATGTIVGPNNNPGGAAPSWAADLQGDVQPTSSTAGDVGDHFEIFQGNNPLAPTNTPAGVAMFSQYGAAIATFGNATDFFDSLSYTALHPGTVTLSPFVQSSGSSYWLNTQSGTATIPSKYQATAFTNPGDTIGTLPKLVINVTGAPPPLHSLISLTSAAMGTPFEYNPLQGSLTASGLNESDPIAEVTLFNTATGYVEVDGFNANPDQEIYAMDVLVNGSQASTAQIALLVNAINNGDNAIPASPGIHAADSYADLGITHGLSPFTGQYNLFLDSLSTPGSVNFLAWDFSHAEDSNFAGYTVDELAVVPEPMSFSLVTLAGLGLITRRPKRAL